MTKRWHYLVDETISVPNKPIFDQQDFIKFSNKQSQIIELGLLAQKKKRDIIFINYENLNEEQTYFDVLDFLNYSGPDRNIFYQSKYQKSASGTVIERFDNPSVVLEYLKKNNLMRWENE